MRSSVVRGVLLCLGTLIVPFPVVLAQTATTAAQRRGAEELLTLHNADRAAHFGHDIQAILNELGPDVLDIREVRSHVSRATPSASTLRSILLPRRSQPGTICNRPLYVCHRTGQWDGWPSACGSGIQIPSGRVPPADQVEAWTSQYEKTGNHWQLVAVTTTDQH